MRMNDALSGAILIVFAAAEMAYTQTFPKLFGQQFGPDLFPLLIGAGLLLCGAALCVAGWRHRRTEPLVDLAAFRDNRGAALDFALVIGALIFYIAASDAIGFIPASVTILVVLLVRFGTGLVTAAITAVVTTLIINQLFAKVLLVPLPWGLLQPVAW